MRQSKAFLLALALGTGSLAHSQNCQPLAAEKQSALVEYVGKEYKLDESSGLRLAKENLVPGSCYRALTFEGKSQVRTWQLTLYLSPDQRFLTSELFDTTLDPVQEGRKKAAALMAGLAPNIGASKGSNNAPVTIVEFSDFECPFCRRFAGILDQLSPSERVQVRIVFHHFPLPMHPWARTAAEGAACAQLQNSAGFWAIHDQVFHHQQEITVDNIKQKLIEYAQGSKALDMKTFQTCIDNEMSLGLVFRDMNLASENDIQATPTLFINGHRVSGVKDADELRRLIAQAKQESVQPSASDAAITGQ